MENFKMNNGYICSLVILDTSTFSIKNFCVEINRQFAETNILLV